MEEEIRWNGGPVRVLGGNMRDVEQRLEACWLGEGGLYFKPGERPVVTGQVSLFFSHS